MPASVISPVYCSLSCVPSVQDVYFEAEASYPQTHIFTSSERVSARILSAGLSPNRLTYIQTQRYTLRVIGTKKVRIRG